MENNIEGQTHASKFLGLPRPLEGAFIGILLTLLIILPFEFLPSSTNLPHGLVVLGIIGFGFGFLGRMTVVMFNVFAGFAMSPVAGIITITVISSIPPAILGWMIASYKKTMRIVGIMVLLIYIIISAYLGFAMASLAI
jgi:hypothetical protein